MRWGRRIGAWGCALGVLICALGCVRAGIARKDAPRTAWLAAASTVETLPAAAHTPCARVSIQTADADALELLPGIGKKIAQRIVDYREAHQGFVNPEELTRIEGIGAKTMERLRPLICVCTASPAPDA